MYVYICMYVCLYVYTRCIRVKLKPIYRNGRIKRISAFRKRSIKTFSICRENGQCTTVESIESVGDGSSVL